MGVDDVFGKFSIVVWDYVFIFGGSRGCFGWLFFYGRLLGVFLRLVF